MARSTEPESYAELAEVCLWEADRTLDREVEQSLRALADRYRRMSENEPVSAEALNDAHEPTPPRLR
jgi:hypothetical protein